MGHGDALYKLQSPIISTPIQDKRFGDGMDMIQKMWNEQPRQPLCRKHRE